jgi:hypothetical protein
MISHFEKWGWHDAAPLGDLANFERATGPPHERSGSSLARETPRRMYLSIAGDDVANNATSSGVMIADVKHHATSHKHKLCSMT